MRPFAIALACFYTIARCQQATVYPDSTTLFANQTELAVLNAFLAQNIDLENQYSHLGNVTFLAASNDAFVSFQQSTSPFNQPANKTILAAILSYHVLQGQYPNITQTLFAQSLLEQPSAFTGVTGGQMVKATPNGNGNVSFISGQLEPSHVVAGPLFFNGGVVYIIDRILTVPMDVSHTLTWDNLTETSGALNLTGVTSSIESSMDVTIFAPSNLAVESIGSVLQNMSTSQLTSLMQYHVVSGQDIYSTEFTNMQIKTSSGQNITMTKEADGSVFINNAKVIQSDILMSNGVIHVIDNVLNPDVLNPPATPTTGYVAYSGASNVGPLYTNEAIGGNAPTLSPSNSTTSSGSGSSPSPSPSAASHPSDNKSVSAGAIAAIVIASLVGIALIVVAFIYGRRKGYGLKMSRRSVISISWPKDRAGPFELPPEGGSTEKAELPGSEIGGYHSRQHSHSQSGLPSRSGATEYTTDETALTESSEFGEKAVSPMSPPDGPWERSADNDTRQRIERFLRPYQQI